MKRLFSMMIAFVMLAACAFAELPRPDDTGIDMVIGEHMGEYYAEVQLFYESGNGMELTGVTRNVYVPQDGNLVEAALTELFAVGEDKEYLSTMPGDAYVKSVKLNCGIATVDLAANMGGIRDEGELVSMLMAVSNTLTGIEGVEHVNVLINSRQESICGLPLGTLTHEETSIATVWSGLQAESDFFTGSSATGISLERDAVLYFPSANGQWLLPEAREISFADDAYADTLLAELMKGPTGGEAYSSFISNGANILNEESKIVVNDSGERILVLSLSGIVRDYLLLQDISDWQFAGAITLTMTSFIPEIDGIQLLINGESYSKMNIKGNFREIKDGILRHSDFDMYTGSTCLLYFSDNEGYMSAVQRTMSSERAFSPYALLIQLISGPSAADTDVYRTMPAGITANDLLGVAVVDDIAIVNMSANFYRLCQALNEEEERTVVYSIVNTLSQIPGINAVSIKIEGESIETLAGNIYLLSELMPNPGIIR